MSTTIHIGMHQPHCPSQHASLQSRLFRTGLLINTESLYTQVTSKQMAISLHLCIIDCTDTVNDILAPHRVQMTSEIKAGLMGKGMPSSSLYNDTIWLFLSSSWTRSNCPPFPSFQVPHLQRRIMYITQHMIDQDRRFIHFLVSQNSFPTLQNTRSQSWSPHHRSVVIFCSNGLIFTRGLWAFWVWCRWCIYLPLHYLRKLGWNIGDGKENISSTGEICWKSGISYSKYSFPDTRF